MAAVIPFAMKAVQAAGIAKSAGGQASNISKEMLGYDFVGLGVKILMFQVIALLVAKYIELVIGTNNALKGLLNLLGVATPSFLPQAVVDFYTTGWNGIKYWDVIKMATIVLIFIEYMNYRKSQKALGGQPSAFTEGLFMLLIGFFLVITLPEMIQRFKDSTALKPEEFQRGIGF